jgi:DNA-binding protein H-NS
MVAEIEQQINELAERRAQLEAELVTRRAQAAQVIADDVRERCAAEKVELGAVLDILRPGKAKPVDTAKSRVVYRDQQGREYRGGKAPTWMQQAMASVGMSLPGQYAKTYMSRAA